jgi:hypothetical protein
VIAKQRKAYKKQKKSLSAGDVAEKYLVLILPSPNGKGILEQPRYRLSKVQSKHPY